MDNPRKKKADSKRVSQQPHEQAYQKKKAARTGGKSARKATSGSPSGNKTRADR